MKKLAALFLSVIMIFSCIPNVFAEDTNSDRIIYTQEFMDSVDAYVEQLGAWLMKDDAVFESTLPDGKVILYYKGLKIYKEEADRVIFGLTDGLCTVTEEVIDGYVFVNPSFFGYNLNENKTGLCVYEKGEIYSVRDAVKKGMFTAEELANIIPFTVKENETTPPPTISPEPSTATVPTTKETDPTEVEPLPTIVDDVNKGTEPDEDEPLPMPTEMATATVPATKVTEPAEKPTEGKWESPAEPTEPVVTEPETEQTEATEESVVEQQPKIKSNTKKVKFSKVKKAKQTVSNAITVENYQGKLKYQKVEKGSSKYLNINKNSGKITVKKGTKKGIHKIKVRITAKGNARSKALSKIVVVKIKVK